jgi:hypothetical protein
MSFLRYTALVALALWIGGLTALGVAAPTIFSVLEAHNLAAGRELGGLVFGAIFARFLYAAWAFGAIVLISLGARAALGPRPRRFGIRMWTAALMLAMSVGTSLAIVPGIRRIETSVEGSIAALPADDARRVAFGRLHGLANGLMALTCLLGLGLVWTEMKDQP